MMAFDNFNDFVTMCYMAPIGEIRCHGDYVWAAYEYTLVVIAGNIIASVLRKKRVKKMIRRKIQREQKQHESKA